MSLTPPQPNRVGTSARDLHFPNVRDLCTTETTLSERTRSLRYGHRLQSNFEKSHGPEPTLPPSLNPVATTRPTQVFNDDLRLKRRDNTGHPGGDYPLATIESHASWDNSRGSWVHLHCCPLRWPKTSNSAPTRECYIYILYLCRCGERNVLVVLQNQFALWNTIFFFTFCN